MIKDEDFHVFVDKVKAMEEEIARRDWAAPIFGKLVDTLATMLQDYRRYSMEEATKYQAKLGWLKEMEDKINKCSEPFLASIENRLVSINRNLKELNDESGDYLSSIRDLCLDVSQLEENQRTMREELKRIKLVTSTLEILDDKN